MRRVSVMIPYLFFQEKEPVDVMNCVLKNWMIRY